RPTKNKEYRLYYTNLYSVIFWSAIMVPAQHKVKLAFWLYFYFLPDVPDYLRSPSDFNTASIVYISIYYLFLLLT
ncbi:hypothetical protein D4G10_24350, partial [Salmonella enterica subsp. enterica]|nr:hypothetical protein [Salmonella enterica subsp. enterica serovar Corvallis]